MSARQRPRKGRAYRTGRLVARDVDLYHDLNLRARDYVVTIDHRPAFDVLEHPGATVRLSETPSRVVGPCPELGQHNRDVFGGLLGLSDEELQRLVDEKALY